jgi:outer membrane autotransporter protein
MQSAFNFNSRAIAGKSAGSSPRAGFWIQSGYTYVDNDENGGQFDGNIISVVAGFDYKPAKFNNKLVVGIAAGYENLDIDTAFNNGTFEGDGFTITPYAGYSFNKHWSISALAGIGFIDYENSRNNGGVNGDFEALRAFGSVNLTGNYRLKNKWRLTPSAGVMGLWEEQDSYNETGTSTAAVGKTSVHLVRINAGLEVGYQIKKSIEPFVSARLQYDPDRNSAVTLTTGSTASDDELGGVFGAGLNLSGKKVNGQIKYETQQFKNELQTHSVIGRVRFNF